MCGIVAFTGNKDAKQFLLDGLFRLEYRGYDSAGIALLQPVAEQHRLKIIKRKGKVAELVQAVAEDGLCGNCGIGHTRWATHGVPSELNAHPHGDCGGKVAVVHNGIIENYAHLKEGLIASGHQFVSQTDTEVIAHLVEQNYLVAAGDFKQAVRATVAQLSGSFALAIVHAEHPDTVIVTRNDSPLVVGRFDGGAIAASDIPALIEKTRDVVYIRDRDIAVLHGDGSIEYFDPAGEPFSPNIFHVSWDLAQAEKGGHPDFMLKEINEQPRVIRDTVALRFDDKLRTIVFDELSLTDAELADVDRIYIVACGTSYHAGLIGKNLIEGWARLPVEVVVSSEFRYGNPIISKNTMVIAISQSG